MHDKVAEFLTRVGHFGAESGGGEFADVADLAAGFAVERRLVEDQRSALARIERFDFDAVFNDRANDALGGLGLVTEKLGRTDALAEAIPDRFGRSFPRARPGPARLRPARGDGPRLLVGAERPDTRRTGLHSSFT